MTVKQRATLAVAMQMLDDVASYLDDAPTKAHEQGMATNAGNATIGGTLGNYASQCGVLQARTEHGARQVRAIVQTLRQAFPKVRRSG